MNAKLTILALFALAGWTIAAISLYWWGKTIDLAETMLGDLEQADKDLKQFKNELDNYLNETNTPKV